MNRLDSAHQPAPVKSNKQCELLELGAVTGPG